jgi:hypothetical protein
MILRIILSFSFWFLSFSIFSQTTHEAKPLPTSERLGEVFKKGQHHGNFRSFFMATDNARGLSDYYGLAAGGYLHFQTASFKRIRMGLAGSFHFNLASSDFTQKDPLTNALNRYEIGLFDVENPTNRRELNRLEELWLRYEWDNTWISLGRQILQTPLINYQDGRMRPTAEEGVWISSTRLPSTKIEGGWLWAISPRSTIKWHDVGASIGIYPRGLNPDGTASGYPENLSSKGVGLWGMTTKVKKIGKIQLWDQYVQGVFNTTLLQTDWEFPLQKEQSIVVGIMGLHQNALGNGGNEDPAKTYFPTNQVSNAISAQLGWKKEHWQALGAYTRITADGRFLSPREWGREPFYTFISRERVEGSGDSHSFTGRLIWQDSPTRWRTELAYGQFYLPDIKQAALNKYAFPSFRQVNLDVRYTFGGALEGLRAHVLILWKGNMGNTYDQPKYQINKVDMWHYNLILNYHF